MPRKKQTTPDGAGAAPRLTPQQFRVFFWLNRELRPTAVAARMQVAPDTVRMHIKRANERFGTHSYFATLLLLRQCGTFDRPHPT